MTATATEKRNDERRKLQAEIKRFPEILKERQQIRKDRDEIDQFLSGARFSLAAQEEVREKLEAIKNRQRKNDRDCANAQTHYPQFLINSCPDEALNQARADLLEEKRKLNHEATRKRQYIQTVNSAIEHKTGQLNSVRSSSMGLENAQAYTDRVAEIESEIATRQREKARHESRLQDIEQRIAEVCDELSQIRQKMIMC